MISVSEVEPVQRGAARVVAEAGMEMEASWVHPTNASAPMEAMPSERVTEVRPQAAKAFSPMDVTPSGMVAETIFSHQLKA